MFARRLQVRYTGDLEDHKVQACPIQWIDNFAMRNFTNDAIFDDTLPLADGLLEVGYQVPLEKLQIALTDWFRRKSYLKPGERVVLEERS